jgi:hypothetical protein
MCPQGASSFGRARGGCHADGHAVVRRAEGHHLFGQGSRVVSEIDELGRDVQPCCHPFGRRALSDCIGLSRQHLFYVINKGAHNIPRGQGFG